MLIAPISHVQCYSPHLSALDILPSPTPGSASTDGGTLTGHISAAEAQDELLEILAFISKEIVIRLLDAGRTVAQKRIERAELQAAEAATAEAAAAKQGSELAAARNKTGKVSSDAAGWEQESAGAAAQSGQAETSAAEVKGSDHAGTRVGRKAPAKTTAPARKKPAKTAVIDSSSSSKDRLIEFEGQGESKQRAAAAAAAAAEKQRIAELSSRPHGPFTGPSASSSGSAAVVATPTHSRHPSTTTAAAAEPQPKAGPTTGLGAEVQHESEKRDPTVGSDVISPLDVLLGDLEAAALELPVLGSAAQITAAGRSKRARLGTAGRPAWRRQMVRAR